MNEQRRNQEENRRYEEQQAERGKLEELKEIERKKHEEEQKKILEMEDKHRQLVVEAAYKVEDRKKLNKEGKSKKAGKKE